jgi:hypothetical protein
MLWVRIPIRWGVPDATLCDKVSGFLRVLLLHHWNIVESGIKHQNPTVSANKCNFYWLYVYCFYPAISKGTKQLADVIERSKVRVIPDIF